MNARLKGVAVLVVIGMISALAGFISCDEQEVRDLTMSVNHGEKNILVFSKTTGWRHESISAGQKALMKLATENGYGITMTENAGYFTPENLEKYKAVIFLNTTETLFDDSQRTAFLNYIQSGGGYVGIHSAADTEYDWPWYNKLVGAYFDNHPNNPNVRQAEMIVTNHNHPATEDLPARWVREDEWYNFRDFNEEINVIMELNTDSYEGSDHPGDHPVAWFHEYDGGRAFYTALGHTSESFEEALFLKHLWGGVVYAAGEAKLKAENDK